MRAWQNSTNASFAAITTGVVGHSVSSRSKVMISMGRAEPARADVDARAALRDAGDAGETPLRREAASPAATLGAKQARAAAIVARAEMCRERCLLRRDRRSSSDVSDILNSCRTIGGQTMLRAPTTALAPSGGIAASPARARVAARGKTAAARGAVPVGAADARARDGSTSNTFKMMFASASRLRARAPSRGAVRVSASASASAPAAGAPGDSPDSESADSGDPYLTSKRLYPHLELDFKPRLSIPALISAVVSSWAAVVAYAVFFSKFHLRHYTLSLKALYLEIFSFAIVGAGAFWVVKTLLAEAQEQARLVPASAAADPDSKFASVDGLDVHYKLSEWDSDSDVSTRIVVSCVHGFGANTYSWERATLGPLSKKLNATAVAHDAPGFGLTERVGDLKRYTPRTNAAIARAMLDLAEGTLNEEDDSKKEKTWNDVVHEMSSDEASATETTKEKRSCARVASSSGTAWEASPPPSPPPRGTSTMSSWWHPR
jgi:hypothetical protein